MVLLCLVCCSSYFQIAVVIVSATVMRKLNNKKCRLLAHRGSIDRADATEESWLNTGQELAVLHALRVGGR